MNDKNKSKEIIKLWVNNNPLEAVKQNGYSIKYIKNPDYEYIIKNLK